MTPPSRAGRGAAAAGATALLVALAAFLLFLPASRNEFVNYDDDRYITGNPMVAGGLTRAGAAWAFTTFHMGNWHPLTWLSHQLDVSLFGMAPAGHHLESAALHGLAAALLFLALRAMTGAAGAAALAAALFALHPLRVESVAWAAERKDVLAALSWSLALLLYARHARRPGAARLLPVTGVFALGLLAKPSVVTLPVVLLILDLWPLGRLRRASAVALLREKAPLFALAAASSVVALFAQAESNTLGLNRSVAFAARIANAAVSCVAYLAKGFWPAGLAHYYPHPHDSIDWAKAAAAALLLAGVSAAAWRLRRSRPWLLAGWAWYLVALLPMIGIIQVGAQAMADRYTYLTLTGIGLAVAWEARALGRRHAALAPALAAVACAALVALSAVTHRQIGYWRDTITLSRRALAVTRDNWFVENNLGAALASRGEFPEAIRLFRDVLRLQPNDVHALNNMGAAYFRLDRYEEAYAWISRAAALAPGNREVMDNLAAVSKVYLATRPRPGPGWKPAPPR